MDDELLYHVDFDPAQADAAEQAVSEVLAAIPAGAVLGELPLDVPGIIEGYRARGCRVVLQFRPQSNAVTGHAEALVIGRQ